MVKFSVVACGALALVVGCSDKKDEGSSGGLDMAGKAGQGGGAGSTSITLGGGKAGMGAAGAAAAGQAGSGGSTAGGGGSAGTSSLPTCTSTEIACNDGCVSADHPDVGNCKLLVPDDNKRANFLAMDLDGNDLFASAGDTLYRVDRESGALSTVTSIDGTNIWDLKASGDSIYFFNQSTGTDMIIMKVARTGGTPTAMTGVINSSGEGSPMFVSNSYLVYESGTGTLQSLPLAGGDATSQSIGFGNFGAYAASPSGTAFYTSTLGVDTTLLRGPVPFPFPASAETVGALTSSIAKLEAEDDFVYVYENNTYERIPAAGGTLEVLGNATNPSKFYAVTYLTSKELVYATTDGLAALPATGGDPVPVGKLKEGTAQKLAADADYVFALSSFEIVRFARR